MAEKFVYRVSGTGELQKIEVLIAQQVSGKFWVKGADAPALELGVDCFTLPQQAIQDYFLHRRNILEARISALYGTASELSLQRQALHDTEAAMLHALEKSDV